LTHHKLLTLDETEIALPDPSIQLRRNTLIGRRMRNDIPVTEMYVGDIRFEP
jgi:hypothetical protein